MFRKIAVLTTLAIVIVPAFAQPAPQAKTPAAEGSAVAEKQIMTTLHAMYEAEKRKDLDFIFAHMSDDFAEVAGDGRIYRKSDIAAEFKNVVLHDYSFSDCVFNLTTADSAYLTCNMQGSAEFKGQPFPGNMRVTWLWTLDKAAWKLRFEQATLIPPNKTDSSK